MKILNEIKTDIKADIIGIGLVTLGILFLVSLYTSSGDLAGTEAGAGILGSLIVRVLDAIAGKGRYVFPVLIIMWGIHNLSFIKLKTVNYKIVSTIVIFVIFLAFLHMQEPQASRTLAAGLEGHGGGIIGALISIILMKLFGINGSYIIMTGITVAAIIVLTDYSIASIAKKYRNKIKNTASKAKNKIVDFIYETVDDEDKDKKDKTLPNVECENTNISPTLEQLDFEVKGEGFDKVEKPVDETEQEQKPEEVIVEETVVADKESISEGINSESEGPQVFQLPSIDLLKKNLKLKTNRMNKDISDRVGILEQTLANFGIKVKVTQVSVGPVITRYEMQPAPGIKVSKIVNLADDLSLSLAAPSVRIEAPIPGKAAVGIEVPNSEVATVNFREVLEANEFQQSSANLPIALGKDIAGKPIVGDLTSMPHLLVAGATGSGKSVCMNTIVTSLLYRAKPDELKILMIDPKKVELTTYNGIPHLISPVITDAKKAASSLKWVVDEMEKRYEIFAEAGAKDIIRYNKLVSRDDGKKLPYVVVLIDELSDLMMVAPMDVEEAICRIAQMARAAGIHLVIATQRPSVDVITGLIKANIPSRIAFAVSSQTDSRTILDMGGAEKLLGKGDMLYFPAGANKPVRVQGGFLSDQEVEKVVKHLKDQSKPEFEKGITDNQVNTSEVKPKQELDPLLYEAAKLLVEQGQASISMLQRKFRIGYARAARIVDALEEHGIIGGYEGSKPRNILVSEEELEQIFNSHDPEIDKSKEA
ncbi:S-DNA-T family DNA segregation ATPase FtsK/SpoIIIE [Desulfitispora alkaliphila]